MSEYEGTRRVIYESGAVFVPVCEKCGRYVKADKAIFVNEITGLKDTPNATCSKCGRVQMLFEGFIGDE
jgi:ribosomal protein L32